MVQGIIPLLFAERWRPCDKRSRGQRQHLDAVDVLLLSRKPSSEMDLVLEENAGYMILGKIRMVVLVVVHHQEIFTQGGR